MEEKSWLIVEPNENEESYDGIIRIGSAEYICDLCFKNEDDLWHIVVSNQEAVSGLLQYSFLQLKDYLYKITISPLDDPSYEDPWSLILKPIMLEDGFIEESTIYINPLIKARSWKNPYTIDELFQKIGDVVDNGAYDIDQMKLKFGEVDTNDPRFIFTKLKTGCPLMDIYCVSSELSKTIIKEAMILAKSAVDNQTLVTYFDFPEHIKTPCSQYLLYFVQFLQDIGIEAETEIREEAHQTLFKVTPKDGSETLEKIKEALNLYLNAPGFETGANFDANYDIAAIQWQANISHLKSQLMLSHATLQLKDQIIQLQQFQLSKYESKNTIAIEDKSEKNEKEVIIPGLLSIKNFDGKWFQLNLADLARAMKRRLKI